ncbi:MAG TPA: PhnA domain-containing protein [Niabella sp.]|nr:PhnA domain-containing protein [Niabella sp.]HOZ98236.1 PhnA domain-containing protein [Niabella sp.]HQW13204.1 PhnA domain-containing protein [Niabella sp.]HQX18756.1 PhnA domain-containing protein [Niabella sp.]HQX41145.1 PhnA domain-containing protein [Niabella sp.]
MHSKLTDRSGGQCELCSSETATQAYTVSPKTDETENQVALCDTCFSAITNEVNSDHLRCLEGSIWNAEPAVQALSYRLLHTLKDQEWANDVLQSVELDEATIQWALSAFEVVDVHKDAFGNTLENGDTVVLTQALNVKGTSFSAAKGTVVKKIRLVADNTGQIEGKINEQMIVILTKYVKKN